MAADLVRASSIDGRNEAPRPSNLRFVVCFQGIGWIAIITIRKDQHHYRRHVHTPRPRRAVPTVTTAACCLPFASLHINPPTQTKTHAHTGAHPPCLFCFRDKKKGTYLSNTRHGSTNNNKSANNEHRSPARLPRAAAPCHHSLVEEVQADRLRLRNRTAVRRAQARHLNAAYKQQVEQDITVVAGICTPRYQLLTVKGKLGRGYIQYEAAQGHHVERTQESRGVTRCPRKPLCVMRQHIFTRTLNALALSLGVVDADYSCCIEERMGE